MRYGGSDLTRQLRFVERSRLRQLFLDASADESRVRERARRERAEAERWETRALLASSRGQDDLSRLALERSAAHRRRADMFAAELADQRRWLDELNRMIREPSVPGVRRYRHPSVATVEERLAALEKEARLERDLAELKRRRQQSAGHESTTL